MTNIEGTNTWVADEGKFFRRTNDKEYCSTVLCLGKTDDIKNYKEVKLTKRNDVEGILSK